MPYRGPGGGPRRVQDLGGRVEMTRTADGARAMSRGRVPKPNAYGRVRLANLVGDDAEGLDPERVFDRDAGAAGAYLREHEEGQAEEERYRTERDAEREARLEAEEPRPGWVLEEF